MTQLLLSEDQLVAKEWSPRGLKAHWIALAVSITFSAIVLFPMVFGGQTNYGMDCRYHQDPMRGFLRAELLEGRVAQWWPAIRCGYPVHAYGEGGLLYPLNALLWQVCDVPQATDIAAFVHLILIALAGYSLARVLGTCVGGALFTGLALAGGGSTIGSLDWPNALACQAMGLWALVFVARGARQGSARAFLIASIFWAQSLAGSFRWRWPTTGRTRTSPTK